MPITQSRLRDLLEEYETTISAIQLALRRARGIMESETLSGVQKADLLFGELAPLGALPRMLALVERRDLNRSWKRNQRQADIAARKRRERGVPERGKPTDSDWLPRAHFGEQYIADDGYDAWEREEAAKGPAMAPPAVSPDQVAKLHADDAKPRALPAEYDIFLCQHELGLADQPTEAQLAQWREKRRQRERSEL
jgi:hypothetical protein